jgi:hypothetical protein
VLTEQGLFVAVEDLAEALPLAGRVEWQGSDASLLGAGQHPLLFVADFAEERGQRASGVVRPSGGVVR